MSALALKSIADAAVLPASEIFTATFEATIIVGTDTIVWITSVVSISTFIDVITSDWCCSVIGGESRFAFAAESAIEVITVRSVWAVVRYIDETFVDVITGMSIAVPTRITFTLETTFSVSARGIVITCVVTVVTFLDIDAFSISIVSETSLTSTAKASGEISTVSVGATEVGVVALIDI